jgi:DNA-binding MarR family transcriptional regulator
MNQPVIDPGWEVFNLLQDIQANIQKMDEHQMRIHRLTRSEYRLLNLCPAEIPCTCKTLSHHLGLSVSRTSRILDRMVHNRLVERRCDKRDRRQCRIRLSPKGREVQKRILEKKEELRLRLRSACPPDEMKRLVENLKEITGISRAAARNTT